MESKKKKIVLYSHSCEDTTGIDDELVNYLVGEKYEDIVIIQFPFTFSKKKAIVVKRYKSGKESRKYSVIRFYKPEFLSYIKDFFYGLVYGISYCRGAKILIASNNLLTIVGLVLKKLGVVEKVAYNMIDYSPVRYGNSFMNSLYYRIDRIACYGADMVLPLIKENITTRAKNGQLDIERVKWRTMPFGNNSHLYSDSDYEKYSLNKIVYFGGVVKSKGAELFVPIIQELIRAGMKNIDFHCIGGGDTEAVLNEARLAGVETNLTLHGRIKDHHEVEKHLLGCSVAIAPYFPEDRNSFSYYADPGKIKVYLGCGLPVVITDVPPIARELEKEGAGLVAEYDSRDIANKVHKILKNREDYLKFRKQARRLGRQYSWEKIFAPVISDLLT